MALPTLRGRIAWIFAEDNYDVDQIIGVKNIRISDVKELAALAMQVEDPDFAKNVQPGDLLVGGRNFGYGHPHYPPMRGMRHLGIKGMIAESFAPGYWRGEISMGFPQVACLGILGIVQRWDEVEVDWDAGLVRNRTNGKSLPFEPLSYADRLTIEEGGVVEYIKRAIAEERRQKA